MPLGYLGYLQLESVFLLCNSTGLNRVVEPLLSTAVWGAGWRNAAATTNYADSQQYFQGGMAFELQAMPAIWNRFRDWLIEQRAYPKSVLLSPNGQVVHNYAVDGADPRTGVWLTQCAFNIDNSALVTCSATGMALRRTETVSGSTYLTGLRTNVGIPTSPLNPTPRNRNPIPGWNVGAEVTWPGAPAFWSTANLQGMVLRKADFTQDNHTLVVKGCTGDSSPVAVLQGAITVEGNMTMWRDGGIPDPYAQPGGFTAASASVVLNLGGTPALTFRLPHVLLKSDDFGIKGQNEPVERIFGMAGLGDGVDPPLLMDAAS